MKELTAKYGYLYKGLLSQRLEYLMKLDTANMRRERRMRQQEAKAKQNDYSEMRQLMEDILNLLEQEGRISVGEHTSIFRKDLDHALVHAKMS